MAQGRVPPVDVVPAVEIRRRIGFGLRVRGPGDLRDQLALERREDALDNRVVPAVAPPVYAAHDSRRPELSLIAPAGVLPAASSRVQLPGARSRPVSPSEGRYPDAVPE